MSPALLSSVSGLPFMPLERLQRDECGRNWELIDSTLTYSYFSWDRLALERPKLSAQWKRSSASPTP